MLRLLSILILTCFKQQVCHEKGTESAGQLSLQHLPTVAITGHHRSMKESAAWTKNMLKES
jgi:hypothetical protein